jgi:elongation factor 1-alpha
VPPDCHRRENAKLKRFIKVVDPEKHDGHIEYKRQLIKPSSSRLRSLATQMSYRLDEGHGTCTYFLGVEDDGCHSLLPYTSIAESARVLECIARSLNSIVVKRTMVQNEIQDNDHDHDHDHGNGNDSPLVPVQSQMEMMVVMRVDESPVFKFVDLKTANGFEEKKMNEDDDDEVRLQKESMTRCEVTILRIETHMLDSSPIRLVELLANGGAGLDDVISEISKVDLNGNGNEHENENGNANANGSRQNVIGSTSGNGHDNTDQATSVYETLNHRNIRVAVVGNVDAGKSTLIGTLTTSSLDDGRGRSRTTIMKHRHEIESGRTSTASAHLMGFRHTGEPIAGRDTVRANKRKSEDEVAKESYRIVTLLDLAGHEKYLKTTIHGVSSGMSDYSMILVNSRHPPTHMTQHHLHLCCSFGIPTIIVFTKIDGCPEHAIKTSKEEVFKLLRAPDIGRKPFAVRTEEDITTCIDKLHVLAPVIDVSCVTGEGLNLLRKMLFCLPKRRRHETKASRSFEFLVEDLFNVPGVGSVVSGFVNAGELTVGSNCPVFVGPMDDGSFIKTVAKSAHIARINTTHVTAGQSACLALALKKEERTKLRRGMVVLQDSPTSTREFDAEICVLKGEGTTIRKTYQAYVHILNVRQTAFAKTIEIVNTNATGLPPSHKAHNDDEDGIVLRPGSRAKVRFEFAQRPEYVRPGMRMLFRDGRVRGVGLVTGVPTTKDGITAW